MPFNFNPFTGKLDLTSTGDVVGPALSTDNAIVRFNSTTGKLVQNSGITIDDNDNFFLPTNTNGQTIGFIYNNGNRFLHTYYGTDSAGYNLFLGENAGNFTMASDNPAHSYKGSYNIGIGGETLLSLTTGYYNFAMGRTTGRLITTGSGNVMIGNFVGYRLTAAGNNTLMGNNSGQNTTGGNNTMYGSNTGIGVFGTSTFAQNSAFGSSSGAALTTGTANCFYGYLAGSTITSGGSNIMIGANTAPSAVTASNELNIGGVLFGTGMYGTGRFGIGITSANITARLHLPAGTTAASSAPVKFTSGSLMTAAEVGAVEMLTDKLYFTITTGAAREEITLNDIALTSGRVPFATTNGRLTDDADMTFATDTLTVTKIVGSTSIKAGSAGGFIASDNSAGVTGEFVDRDGLVITVTDGLITNISL